MAAFTTFTREALIRYLRMFGIRNLNSFEPIAEGIENSTYFIKSIDGGIEQEYVLSIIEQLSLSEIPFFNQILQILAASGVPVPAPKRTLDGMTSTIFCGKPTLLVPKLAGKHVTEPSVEQCKALGRALADIHLLLDTQVCLRENPYSPDWMEKAVCENAQEFAWADLVMLKEITREYRMSQEYDLPKGIIHGDLFRDNALFIENTLTGIIDFFNACNDFLVQDIAVVINDWCVSKTKGLVESRRDALLDGYSGKRELKAQELENLTKFQMFSAARFALTRQKRDESGEYLKDPGDYIDLTRELYQSI